MKRANGEGSITVLKGKHGKRLQARVTEGFYYDEEKDRVVQKQKSLGTYSSYSGAQKAIDNYIKGPYEKMYENMTLDDAFKKMCQILYADNDEYVKELEYKWRYCENIKKMKLSEIRTSVLKQIINGNELYYMDGNQKRQASVNTVMRIKSIFNLIFDVALEDDAVISNYARNFKISKKMRKVYENSKKKHIPFNEQEMKIIEENLDYPFMDMLYIQCYMGWRPDELVELKINNVDLKKGMITGGKKTDNGYNRTVPIHYKILPFIHKYYEIASQIKSEFLFNDLEINRKATVKKNLSYHNYRYRFNKIIEFFELKKDHTPHDPRVTFSTRAKMSGMDSFAVKKFMGHSVKNDVTEDCYTDPEESWYIEQMKKLK